MWISQLASVMVQSDEHYVGLKISDESVLVRAGKGRSLLWLRPPIPVCVVDTVWRGGTGSDTWELFKGPQHINIPK